MFHSLWFYSERFRTRVDVEGVVRASPTLTPTLTSPTSRESAPHSTPPTSTLDRPFEWEKEAAPPSRSRSGERRPSALEQ